MTNKGFRIYTSLFYPYVDGELFKSADVHFLYFGCVAFRDRKPQGIFLRGMEDDVYVRGQLDSLMAITVPFQRDEARTIYIARDLDGYSHHEHNAALTAGVSTERWLRYNPQRGPDALRLSHSRDSSQCLLGAS